MIRGHNDTGAAELVHNDTDKIFDLADCLVAGGENGAVGGVAGLIHCVVVEIHDLHSLHQRLPLLPLEHDDVIILQRYTFGICRFQHFVAVSGIRGLFVCQHSQCVVAPERDGQGFVRQQCRHAVLGSRGEDSFLAAQCYLALHIPLQLLCQCGCNFVTEGVRYDHEHPAVAAAYFIPVEVFLLRDFRNAAVGLQRFGTHIRPILSQLPQKPVSIQSFHLVHHLLEQIVKFGMGLAQTALEAKVKTAVIGVHSIKVSRIGLPDALRICHMEAGRMLGKKGLHIGYLEQPLIVAANRAVPRHGPALFGNLLDCIHLDDLVADFPHQGGQNALVDAGETLGVYQILYTEGRKPLEQACFIFHIAGQLPETSFI